MKIIRIAALLLAGLSAVSPARASTFTENFTTDPARDGWRIFGDTNLFQWNSTNHDLEVTWNSSQPNSYFYRPLGNILGRDDDFQFSFDITISNLTAGVNPDKPDAIEVAVGFVNFDDATDTNFIRALDPLNLAELDYFPYFVDPVYGPFNPSIAPLIVSSIYDYYGAFGSYFTLTNGVSYNVQTVYSSVTGALTTTITLTGDTNVLASAVTAPSVPEDDDFRVDTIAVCGYSDIGDDYDSLYGQGTIANLVFTIPSPPVQDLALGYSNGVWQTQFSSRTNWLYTLQSSADLQSWQTASATAAGTGSTIVLQDTNPPAARAFYRVSAARP